MIAKRKHSCSAWATSSWATKASAFTSCARCEKAPAARRMSNASTAAPAASRCSSRCKAPAASSSSTPPPTATPRHRHPHHAALLARLPAHAHRPRHRRQRPARRLLHPGRRPEVVLYAITIDPQPAHPHEPFGKRRERCRTRCRAAFSPNSPVTKKTIASRSALRRLRAL